MKKKDLGKLRKKDVSDIKKEADKLRTELYEKSVKISVGKEKNTAMVKNLRRSLSQVLTVLNEKDKVKQK